MSCGDRQKNTVFVQGFALIEALAAMIILSMALVNILHLFSGGLVNSVVAQDYNRAIFHAKEKMAEIVLLDELREGVTDGEFDDGYQWVLKVSKSTLGTMEETSERKAGRKMPLKLYEIHLSIKWMFNSTEKEYVLATLKNKTVDDF